VSLEFELDDERVSSELDRVGFVVVPRLLTDVQTQRTVDEFENDSRYRSTIDMARHGFGVGTYRYYSYPLPNLVASLRESLYAQLAPIANSWEERLETGVLYPTALSEFTERCRLSEQHRPTPLILRYLPGHYNCLHQDRYGDIAFPFQVAIMLNAKEEFEGGEFVLVEQRPRMQSRAHVVHLDRGDAVIFPNQVRPVRGTRGYYRTQFRHGVSTLHSGTRHVLGVIFHDAQ
jgi:uncharacterized protein